MTPFPLCCVEEARLLAEKEEQERLERERKEQEENQRLELKVLPSLTFIIHGYWCVCVQRGLLKLNLSIMF